MNNRYLKNFLCGALFGCGFWVVVIVCSATYPDAQQHPIYVVAPSAFGTLPADEKFEAITVLRPVSPDVRAPRP